jgi:L-amino acid N-acyltransferase YncA
MSLYAASSSSNGPSVDFEEQRGFRQGAEATEVVDYFSVNLDRSPRES